MKNLVAFLIILTTFNCHAQLSKVNHILDSEIELIEKLKFEKSKDIIYLRTDFASEKIKNPMAYQRAENKVIRKIELVFTTYKSTMTFQQRELNKKRLHSLYQIDPKLLKNDIIKWVVVGQTECKSTNEAGHYFHGFKITYQPPVKSEEELSYINGVLTGKITKDRDITIANIFKRNSQWNKMLIVADFTSSMYPYSAEVLDLFQHTIKVNKNKILYFTFFNDGDTKPPSKKPIGNTGGIYHCKAEDFNFVKQLALTTIQNGVGGKDIPENNIEAILKGIEKSPDCEDVIMMADNYASPKDLIILPKVTKPIKIIICGYNGIINPDYLDIARQTKGSIHLPSIDIIDLHKIKEGQITTIDNQRYLLSNGQFTIIF